MDIGKTLTNPWVIGGVLAVGAVLLISGRAGAAPSSAGSASAFAAMNASATQQFQTSTAARVALGQAQFQNNAVVAGYFTGALTNLAQVQGQVRIAQAQSNAGVISSLFSNDAALAMDISNNSARVNQTGIVTAGQVVAQTAGARYSQQAAKDASSAGMWSNIVNAGAGIINNAVNAVK